VIRKIRHIVQNVIHMTGRDHSADLSRDRITLKWILDKQVLGVWTEVIWLKIGTCGALYVLYAL
jgi:hypothetical protein